MAQDWLSSFQEAYKVAEAYKGEKRYKVEEEYKNQGHIPYKKVRITCNPASDPGARISPLHNGSTPIYPPNLQEPPISTQTLLSSKFYPSYTTASPASSHDLGRWKIWPDTPPIQNNDRVTQSAHPELESWSLLPCEPQSPAKRLKMIRMKEDM